MDRSNRSRQYFGPSALPAGSAPASGIEDQPEMRASASLQCEPHGLEMAITVIPIPGEEDQDSGRHKDQNQVDESDAPILNSDSPEDLLNNADRRLSFDGTARDGEIKQPSGRTVACPAVRGRLGERRCGLTIDGSCNRCI